MWLKRSRTDNQPEAPEVRCQPSLPKQHVANFSYPRTDFVHLYRKEKPAIRDSTGSDSTPPPLVEDHGSDVSVEDDSHYRVKEADLWDSWNARQHDQTALIRSDARAHKEGSYQGPALTQQHPPTTSYPSIPGSQSGQSSRRVVVSCPEQRQQPPKPPPKASYSLFPPPNAPQKRVPAPLQISNILRQPGLDSSPLSLEFPPTPDSRDAYRDGKSRTQAFRPGSSRATTPRSAHGGSIAASSTESIPLLLRSPDATPPHSPAAAAPSPRVSGSSKVSEHPLNKKRSPSQGNLRKFPLSKATTKSSPSLASLAKAQRQAQGLRDRAPTPADLYDRPLPPLPTARPPSPPPNVSVFETDSGDEDGDAKPAGNETKNFARRLMHGLVHHHHHHHNNQHAQHQDKKDKDHKRSVSDDGPSTATSKERAGGGGGRAGISRTLNAAARYRRGGPADVEGAAAARAAVSLDSPREQYPSVTAAATEEGEKGAAGRFWGKKGGGGDGGGEFSLGRVFRRKG